MQKAKAEGWTFNEDGSASYRGGGLFDVFQYRKKVGEEWAYRAEVEVTSHGLSITVEDDSDESGMAHGGSYTSLTIPHEVLTKLLERKSS